MSVSLVAPELLDDLDSRPGSVTSILRTVLGAYLRDAGGWTSIADLTALLMTLDIAPSSSRIAVTRLKKKGVLESCARGGTSGYVLTSAAEAMFTRGDIRIYGSRSMTLGDPWLLISFSLPESERAVRQQLRRRLTFIGCGTVSPGLYICPNFFADDVRDIVAALGVQRYVTMFQATDIDTYGSLSGAAQQWWDLDSLARRHHDFVSRHAAVVVDASGRDAFARMVPALDDWRMIPYVDPGLPAEVLPRGWPGLRSREVFAQVRESYLDVSRAWVRTQIG